MLCLPLVKLSPFTTTCYVSLLFFFAAHFVFYLSLVTAPKKKKPRHVRYDDENSPSLPSRAIKSEAEAPSKSQVPSVDQLKRSGSAEESSSVFDSTYPQARDSTAALDSGSAEKKESNLSNEETVMPKVESSSGVRSDGDGATTISGAKP